MVPLSDTEVRVFNEFKKFIARGNVVDMAVGIAVGGAFGAIAKSLVTDVLMPPIGLLLNGRDVSNYYLVLRHGTPPPPYASLKDATAAGAVTWNYGVFINTVISFFIIAIAIFLVVRAINRIKAAPPPAPVAPTEKECPYCRFKVPLEATRCGHCTSELGPA